LIILEIARANTNKPIKDAEIAPIANSVLMKIGARSRFNPQTSARRLRYEVF
jgi:hypothetical protein